MTLKLSNASRSNLLIAELMRALKVAQLVSADDRVNLDFDGSDLWVRSTGNGDCTEYVESSYQGDPVFRISIKITDLTADLVRERDDMTGCIRSEQVLLQAEFFTVFWIDSLKYPRPATDVSGAFAEP
jgi:hypothetical protein